MAYAIPGLYPELFLNAVIAQAEKGLFNASKKSINLFHKRVGNCLKRHRKQLALLKKKELELKAFDALVAEALLFDEKLLISKKKEEEKKKKKLKKNSTALCEYYYIHILSINLDHL